MCFLVKGQSPTFCPFLRSWRKQFPGSSMTFDMTASYPSCFGQVLGIITAARLHCWRLVSHRVPQGFVLGPVLFIIYMLPLGKMIKKKYNTNFHRYADGTKLYLSIKPDKADQLNWRLVKMTSKPRFLIVDPMEPREQFSNGQISLNVRIILLLPPIMTQGTLESFLIRTLLQLP